MWTWLCVLLQRNFMAKFHFGAYESYNTCCKQKQFVRAMVRNIKCAKALIELTARDVLFWNCQLIWPNKQSSDWKTILPSSNHLIMDLCSDTCPIEPRSVVCFRELTSECSPIDRDLSVSFDLIGKCFQRSKYFWWFYMKWLNAKSANVGIRSSSAFYSSYELDWTEVNEWGSRDVLINRSLAK